MKRLLLVLAALGSGAFAAEENAGRFSDCETCPQMVIMPTGKALIGAEPYEANRKRGDVDLREVTINYRLAIAETETTRAEFRRFVESTGYELAQNGCNTWSHHRILGYVREHTWDNPGYPQNENHPVVCVSHTDAMRYADWLSEQTGKPYRLPSSTEFEYATRAGTRGPWFWGSANADACQFANVADSVFRTHFQYAPLFNCNDGYEHTAPVGSFEANPWGLRDMLGNVWEWTSDCFHKDPAGIPGDGSAWLQDDGGDCSRRTPRGGSWVSGTDWVRAAAQSIDRAEYHSQLLGFRVAMTVPEG